MTGCVNRVTIKLVCIVQTYQMTLKLRLIFLFKNCFLFIFLFDLFREGFWQKNQMAIRSFSSKEGKTLRLLLNPRSLYAERKTLKI